MKILVLGATGFIGKNLVSRLKADKHEVYMCSKSSGIDITCYESLSQTLKNIQPEIIFNVAADVGSLHYVTTYAADVINTNIQMVLNIYKAVQAECPTAKIINPLANCAYPATATIQKEEDWLAGPVHQSVFSFANSKRVVYYLSKCYYDQYKIKTVNLIFPNTYGPGDSCDPNKTHALNGMIIRMLQAKAKNNKKFVVWGTGSPIREWAYVDDFVEVLILAMKIDHMAHPVNVGQEMGYSIAESAHLIKRACNFEGNIAFDTQYPDGHKIKIMHKNKFTELFPDFKFHDHHEGIKNTVLYYRSKL